MTAASYELEVRFYELDPYGHVNHATYLQYFEAARVHWLSAVGQGLDVLADAGCNLVVTAVATRFHAPAVLGDRLTIETGMVRQQRVRAQWAQVASRGDQPIAAQRVNFASVSPIGKPIRTPASLIDAMAEFALPDDWYARMLPELDL